MYIVNIKRNLYKYLIIYYYTANFFYSIIHYASEKIWLANNVKFFYGVSLSKLNSLFYIKIIKWNLLKEFYGKKIFIKKLNKYKHTPNSVLVRFIWNIYYIKVA